MGHPIMPPVKNKGEDAILSELSKKDMQVIRKALEILGRVFGGK